jgi:hypothetical protein
MRWLLIRPWRQALMWLALLAPLFYLTYGLANHWASLQSAKGLVPSIVFDWERHIPFWAWTVIPYWTINFFYGLSLFLARTRLELRRHALRLLTAQIIAVSCFIAFPLAFTFGQPPADGVPGFFFAALRGFDKPFNQAPSLHIALAIILWDFYRRQIHALWARTVLHLWAFAICASVLTTYQHHFIDIPTGALLGCLCVWLWPLERRVSMLWLWRVTSDAKRLKLALYYAIGALVCIAIAWAFNGVWLWLLWPATSLFMVALFYLGFGARGFQTDARGRMHWVTRWLLGPYRLGAWINSRLWTRQLPASSEVSSGVWLGRMPTPAQWRAMGSPAIVSLCPELQNPDPHGHCIPVLDLTPPSEAALRQATLRIAEHHQAGRTVLVCCALGFSRSARVVIAHLLHTGQVSGLTQAIASVQRARPQVVLHP